MFKDNLINDKLWLKYLEYKTNNGFTKKKDIDLLNEFIINKKYKDIVNKINQNKYVFSIPQKHIISKNHSAKKRIVYTYNDDEMIILKYISFLLYDYDYLFSKNLYSFRKNIGVKNAINKLIKKKNLRNMYGYKVDIKNYFNSINQDILLNNLKLEIKDTSLINFFSQILNNKAFYNGNIIYEDKGAIAGSPISAFLANFYLKEIDKYFANNNIFYIRYADDIIIFTNTIEERNNYKEKLYELLTKYDLRINHDKEYFFDKSATFEFLGFSFKDNSIDISKNSIHKIKSKIRRTARGLRKWMLKNNANQIGTLKAMTRKYNFKFFGHDNTELSWKYWFFPIINKINSLKEVDKYYQEHLRYVITGKYNKKNYKIVPYNFLKECNYKSLVNEYYKFKKESHIKCTQCQGLKKKERV